MTFLTKRTLDETLCFMVQLARVCRKAGGPLTNQLFCLIEQYRFQELIDFKIDYTWVFSANDFLYARQIQALVAKQDFIDLGIDKKEVAWQKFLASEEKCKDTNCRIEDSVPDWDVGGVLYVAQRKIMKILGDRPSINALDFSFGPGATTSTKSFEACIRTKLSNSLECSMNLVPLLRELLEELPELANYHCTTQNREVMRVPVTIASGKLAFVPKDCKTDRSIVVEPILNGLGQKGIGKIMKERLRDAGCDLRSQTRNQDLARKGSIDGSLATVDLVSASDTVSRALVWYLLPYDWAEMLDLFRSETVTYKNESIVLEKFSSMGNAYTFELESLIFYALTLSCCEQLNIGTENVSVYGDDIIVPVAAYDLLDRVLQFCGFEINLKKSFAVGPFRESCGADYYGGLDIRPFYLKEILSDRILYVMHNWFFRAFEWKLAELVESKTLLPYRLYGPDGYGDGHLIGNHSLRSNRKFTRAGYGGGFFDTYSLKKRLFKKWLPSDYIYPVYSIYVKGEDDLLDPSEPSDPDTVRGVCGYAKISIYTLASGVFINYNLR